MSDVFISYARSTAKQAQAVAEALRGLGYTVWIDDDLPAHRTYSHVIEEQMTAAKAAVVIWSADAVRSEWVLSEANRAREDRKLVQVITDKTRLAMPFDTIQCADLTGWTGDPNAAGWRKVVGSIAELAGASTTVPSPHPVAPLPLPSKPSIAVMPFANLSGDPEQEYFADGMVEEIAAALSRFRSIFVIGGGSTLTFKGKAVSPQEVGRSLGVRYVLEGSVRKAGARVRIAVRLTDAANGAQIWADRFEDTLEDVFALQDRVALSVAGVIEPTIQQAAIRLASARPTENLGSYDLYLRAFPLSHAFQAATVAEAIKLLERALVLDPDFAAAAAMAAFSHACFITFGWDEDAEEHRRRGIELIRRAVSLGSDDANALAQAAIAIFMLQGDMDTAHTLVERAMALNPGSADVWLSQGVYDLRRGEPDLAVPAFEAAQRLDPFSRRPGSYRMFIGLSRFQQGRFEEARSALKEVIEQNASSNGPAYLAAACGHLGLIDEAQAALLLYQKRSLAPIEGRAMGRPEHRTLFLDGIALAEGKTPS